MYFSMIPNPLKALKYPKLAFEFYVKNFVKIFRAKMAPDRNHLIEKAEKKCQALGRQFLLDAEFNDLFKEKLNEDGPFFLARPGGTELSACFIAELYDKKIINDVEPRFLRKAKTSSGMFPEKLESYLTTTDRYISAFDEVDIYVYLGWLIMEEYLLQDRLPSDSALMKMRALEPFQYEKPWTAALKGKKVLIVHPFSELIESQYKRREQLFKNPDILPEFELKTVKAVQSSGDTVPEGTADWNEALESMLEKIRATDFDIALLGCGSYAVPLGAEIKKMGKKAIVLGGMMQLMFGIKGERWEKSRPDIVALYNDSWVRADAYRVKNADQMVDGAAYW